MRVGLCSGVCFLGRGDSRELALRSMRSQQEAGRPASQDERSHQEKSWRPLDLDLQTVRNEIPFTRPPGLWDFVPTARTE